MTKSCAQCVWCSVFYRAEQTICMQSFFPTQSHVISLDDALNDLAETCPEYSEAPL